MTIFTEICPEDFNSLLYNCQLCIADNTDANQFLPPPPDIFELCGGGQRLHVISYNVNSAFSTYQQLGLYIEQARSI